MVKYSVGTAQGSAKTGPTKTQTDKLNRAFAAIADPTRRAIVAELARKKHGPRSASQLAKPFSMPLVAFMKHIRILEESGLLRRYKMGRTVYCRLNPQALQAAAKWFETFEF